MMRPGNYEKVLALAERSEFQDARGNFMPQSMARPRSAEAGPDGSWNVWRTWSRSGAGPSWESAAGRGPSGTRVEEDAFAAVKGDDDALRRMRDTRTAKLPNTERPGGVELLPDDD
jgi:hypothetical protein